MEGELSLQGGTLLPESRGRLGAAHGCLGAPFLLSNPDRPPEGIALPTVGAFPSGHWKDPHFRPPTSPAFFVLPGPSSRSTHCWLGSTARPQPRLRTCSRGGAEDRADDQRADTAHVSTQRAFRAGPTLCSHLHTCASSPPQEPGHEHRGSLLTSYHALGGAGVWRAWSKVHNPVTSRSQAPTRRSPQPQ